MGINLSNAMQTVTITYDTFDGKKMPIELHLPATQEKPHRLVVLYFGGGWVGGSIAQFRPQAIELARLGVAVALPEYRVFSTDKTPIEVAIKDAVYALEHIYTVAPSYNIDTTKIAIGGGSAGGHLALSTYLLNNIAIEQPSYQNSINTLLLFNPVIDVVQFYEDSNSVAVEHSLYAATEVSPYHNIIRTDADIFIYHGTGDTTVCYDSAEKFAADYKNKGGACTLIPYQNRMHGFFNLRIGQIEDYYNVLGNIVSVLFDRGYISDLK